MPFYSVQVSKADGSLQGMVKGRQPQGYVTISSLLVGARKVRFVNGVGKFKAGDKLTFSGHATEYDVLGARALDRDDDVRDFRVRLSPVLTDAVAEGESVSVVSSIPVAAPEADHVCHRITEEEYASLSGGGFHYEGSGPGKYTYSDGLEPLEDDRMKARFVETSGGTVAASTCECAEGDAEGTIFLQVIDDSGDVLTSVGTTEAPVTKRIRVSNSRHLDVNIVDGEAPIKIPTGKPFCLRLGSTEHYQVETACIVCVTADGLGPEVG